MGNKKINKQTQTAIIDFKKTLIKNKNFCIPKYMQKFFVIKHYLFNVFKIF